MAVTTATKMLSGIVVFVIMARILGPHDFGMVVYSFTLASIFVLLVDYGFSQQLLRDIGAAPESIHQLMGRVLVAKVVLSIAMLILCAIYLLLFPKDKTTEIVFLLLLLSSILASFSEFLNVGFRGIGQFKRETNIATIGAAIHFALLTAILLIRADVIWVSYAFIISRVIYLLISWQAYKKHIGIIQIEKDKRLVIQSIKAGFPYAADAGVTNFFYQVDTLIVTHYLGYTSLGFYQAATKWLQGAMQFAPVLANVYIPLMSANSKDKKSLLKISNLFNIKMLAIGISGSLFFAFFGSLFAKYVYGDTYVLTDELWVGIGFLMFLRYLSGTQGTLLIAVGFQKVRVLTQLFALALLVITAPFLTNQIGVMGMIIALQINVAFVFIVYLSALLKEKQPTGFNLFKVVLSLLMISVFGFIELKPYLHLFL